MAIDHCSLVTRSQDHSQCSSYVVQGEPLHRIDDQVDSVLGLTVFYQYIRADVLNEKQELKKDDMLPSLPLNSLHIIWT